MTDPFRSVFESLKQVADGLITANLGVKALADAVLTAREEHDDVRETVHRLESLVVAQGHTLVAQGQEIRRVSERLEGR